MQITITLENISQYRSGSYSHATIIWGTPVLDPTVLVNFPELRELNCYRSGLKTLEGLGVCSQLRVLNCRHNSLTSLAGLEGCLKLRNLDCDGNPYLTSLAGIENCTRLQRLSIHDCKVLSLAELANCTRLRTIFCSSNRLTSLTGLENCINLEYLFCWGNKLTDLKGIRNCTSLNTLDCSGTKLRSLDGIESCTQLEDIDCSSNLLRVLNPLVYLRNLQYLSYAGNPLEIQTIQVQRVLEHIERTASDSSVYTNNQNVHDVHIQKTVCDSVQALLLDPKPKFSIDAVIQSGLNERTVRLLVEYCSDSYVHSVHRLTYSELFSYVWARIERSEHKRELLRILEEQIADSECKCFTGRFNRTLSVLVGFYSDIKIDISDNSRIGAIIVAAKNQTTPYDQHQHKSLAMILLLQAGYDADVIKPWLEAITEY